MIYKWESIECESVKWINMASDSEKWGGLVKVCMSLSVPQNMFCVLTMRANEVSLNRTLLHGVGVVYIEIMFSHYYRTQKCCELALGFMQFACYNLPTP
jgi:hypothetical protein